MEAEIVFKIITVVSILGLNIVWGIELSKPAYMGINWLNDYIIFSEQKTWLEARDICTSLGGSLQYNKWLSVNWYIKAKAERYGWSITDDVWLGMIKHNNSDKWYKVRQSVCPERSYTIPGQNHFERQCAVLNMSTSSFAGKDMLYAVSCDAPRTMGFVCIVSKGEIPNGVDFYPMLELVEKGSNRKYWNSSSEEECAINSFSTYPCYAATYFPEEDYCVTECSVMPTIPETVTLVNSSVNSTVLLRNYNRVIINNNLTTLRVSTNQYPCEVELSTTSPYTISSVVTNTYTQTEVDTVVSAHSGNTDDTSAQTDITTFTELPNVTKVTQMLSYTTESPSSCPCVCSTNSNNITDAELERKLMEIKKKLTVNKTSLSSTMRKKTSAPDDRISSASMGALGICVILLISISVVAGDIGHVISFIKSLK